MDMRAAVIVVNFNVGDEIIRCLDAVRQQSLQPRRTIVVDNASSDGSPDLIAKHFPEVELLRSPKNLGFAAANNLAAARADDCEWLALLNPDAFAEPGWLEALARAAADQPGCAFFASSMLRADDGRISDGTGDVYHVSGLAWRRDEGLPAEAVRHRSGEVFSSCAAAALYRRDVFLEAGGFDESFFCYHEDTDLAFRLRLAGHRCTYVPAAVVHHIGFGTSGGALSPFTLYHSHRNSVWAWVKNMPTPLLWLYLPEQVLVNLLDLLSTAVRGQSRTGLAAKRDALRGLPRVLRDRRAVQEKRTVGALELRQQMERGFGVYRSIARRGWATIRAARRGEPA